MNKFLNNMPVFMVFLTMIAFSWCYGGSQANELFGIIPWLFIFLFETLIFFPQRYANETIVDARERVMYKLKRDPVLYFSILFLVILIIPFVNKGLCPVCDYPQIMAGAEQKPPMPYLPFCIDREEHFGLILWFLPIFTGLLAVRHSLTPSGKRLFLEFMVWNSTLLALLGFVQAGTGAEFPYWAKEENPVYFFSTFGYPNMGGSFFLMMFCFSIGLWQHRVIETENDPLTDIQKSQYEKFMVRTIRAHYPVVAVVFNFFATMFTLCRAAIFMLMVVSVFAFAYCILRLLYSRTNRAKKVRSAGFLTGGVLLFLIAVFVFAPKTITDEIGSVTSLEALDRISGKGQYHTRVAGEIFKDYPFFGVGGWGYRHFCLQYMTDEEKADIQEIGGINVHNDYMQFLCEHGAVGTLLLISILLGLLIPICSAWYMLYRAARFTKGKDAPPKPLVVFSLPAGTFWILIGTTCVTIHSFADCPLRSGAVLSSYLISLACASGFLVGVKKKKTHGGHR